MRTAVMRTAVMRTAVMRTAKHRPLFRARTFAGAALAGLSLLIGVAPSPAAASPSEASAVASAGCTAAPTQQPGTSVLHTLSSGGRERTYQLRIPAGYSADQEWPVVLAYHGRGSTGPDVEKYSGLNSLPAIVAYPNGVIGTGDGNRQAWQGAPYAAAGVDDVAFTRDLVDALEASWCVDSGRVYATGKSNGGGFTALLACRLADRITAVAPVAAAFYPATGANCTPSRPVPVIDFHGTSDSTIPYRGDADRGLPAIPTWVDGWAGRNGCTTKQASARIEPDITFTGWTDCTSGADVRHVAVTGGGHTWPGADSDSGGGATTRTIEAHEVLWEFFAGRRI